MRYWLEALVAAAAALAIGATIAEVLYRLP